MGSGPRMSRAALRALSAFLDDPGQELSGIEVCAAAGVRSGTLHPVLARLEGMGWLESRWEQRDAEAAAGPARRYYRLTGIGADLARGALNDARHPSVRLRWRPVPGSP